MSSTGYTPWVVTVGEQPTTAYWNLLGANDASFNNGQGFNDNIIAWRHLSTDIIPTGTIWTWAGLSSPSSAWLVCDGSAVSRASYAALFAVCGTNYGAGDGVSTFNLPNLAGKVPVGLLTGDGTFGVLGNTGGEKTHQLSQSEMPSHGHGVNDPGHAHGFTRDIIVTSASGNSRAAASTGLQQFAWSQMSGTAGAGTGIWLNNTGGDQAHNNLQPFTVTNFIIKT